MKKSPKVLLASFSFFLILGLILLWNAVPSFAADFNPEQEWKNVLALYKKKEYLEALPILQRLEKNHLTHSGQADALFMQGQVLRALHRWPEAAQAFARATEAHAQLADYALYYQGEAWHMVQEGRKSLEVFQRLVDHYPASLMVPPAELKMAEIYLQLAEYLRCKEICENLMKKKLRPEYSAEALFLLGRTREGLGQWTQAVETYQDVWLKYPQLPLAKNAKSRWESIGKEKGVLIKKIPSSELLRRALSFYGARLYETAWRKMEKIKECPLHSYPASYAGESWVDELYFHRGMCLFFLKKYSEAVEAFQIVVLHSRNEGMAEQSLFWTIRSLYRMGRKEAALHHFSLFQSTYPKSSFIDRGLYLQAQIFDEAGKIPQAITLYQELGKRFPRSSLRFQATWQAGWLLFKNQDLQGAVQAWDSLLTWVTLPSHSRWSEKVLYWKAKVLLNMGRTQEAEENFQQLLKNYPTSFYSQLAGQRDGSFSTTKGFSSPLQDPPLTFSPEEKSQPQKDQSSHLAKGRILARWGLMSQAVRELEVAEEEGKNAGEIPKEISHLYREVGEYHRSALLVRRNFSLQPLTARPLEKDRELYLLAYPIGDLSWVNPHARSQNLDPALLSAVILEESRYNPQGLSVAGARGLMQMIPRTGRQIAKRLNLHPFSEELLFEPDINLRLGSWYLSHLLQEFGGREAFALAAYNAGPNAVRDWINKKDKITEDEFVETIPYEETKNYVIRVLSSARVYRMLYGSPSPNQGKN
jgi:soluble lytic murein transglycosylase